MCFCQKCVFLAHSTIFTVVCVCVCAGVDVCEAAEWASVGEKMMAAGSEGKQCVCAGVCLCVAAK